MKISSANGDNHSQYFDIFLVRHAQTFSNQMRIIGRLEDELDSKGILQATQLSAKLHASGYKFDAIFTSPFKRAIQTAKILFPTLQVTSDIRLDNRLGEKRYGVFSGKAFDDYLAEAKKHGYNFFTIYDFRAEGGENGKDIESRCNEFLQDLLQSMTATSGSKILAISHCMTIYAFLRYCVHNLGLTDDPMYRVARVHNTSVTTVRIYADFHSEKRRPLRAEILEYNNIDHIRSEDNEEIITRFQKTTEQN